MGIKILYFPIHFLCTLLRLLHGFLRNRACQERPVCQLARFSPYQDRSELQPWDRSAELPSRGITESKMTCSHSLKLPDTSALSFPACCSPLVQNSSFNFLLSLLSGRRAFWHVMNCQMLLFQGEKERCLDIWSSLSLLYFVPWFCAL